MENHPFRILEKELAIELLVAAIEDLGFQIDSHTRTDSAYDDEIIELKCLWLETRPTQINIIRAWEPDGDKYQDAFLSVEHNGNNKLKIDLELLLREKHSEPIRIKIKKKLVKALEEISGKQPNVA